MPINETPPGQLADYLIGDLGVAHRHLERLRQGIIKPSPVVIREIERSIEDCVERINRDVKQSV